MKAIAAVVAAIVAVGALLYVATKPTPPPQMTEAEIAQIQGEIGQAAEEWMNVWRANDCELARGLWHPDHVTQPYAGVIARTVDDWIEDCNTSIANRASFSGSWIDTEVRVISPNAAVLAGNWEGTFHYRDDTPARHYPHSAQVILFERTDAGWGIVFLMSSNDTPQPVGEQG
jgi:uncharacterized membrane protein